MQDGWRWCRWQMVHVEVDGGTVCVDAVELSDADLSPLSLLTLVFDLPADDPDGPALHETLERWAAGGGVCDVLRKPAGAGCLALFHEGESLLVDADLA